MCRSLGLITSRCPLGNRVKAARIDRSSHSSPSSGSYKTHAGSSCSIFTLRIRYAQSLYPRPKISSRKRCLHNDLRGWLSYQSGVRTSKISQHLLLPVPFRRADPERSDQTGIFALQRTRRAPEIASVMKKCPSPVRKSGKTPGSLRIQAASVFRLFSDKSGLSPRPGSRPPVPIAVRCRQTDPENNSSGTSCWIILNKVSLIRSVVGLAYPDHL